MLKKDLVDKQIRWNPIFPSLAGIVTIGAVLIFALQAFESHNWAFDSKDYSYLFYFLKLIIRYGSFFLLIGAVYYQGCFEKRNLFALSLPAFFIFLLITHSPDGYHGRGLVFFTIFTSFVFLFRDTKKRIFSLYIELMVYNALAALIFYVLYKLCIPAGYYEVPYYVVSSASYIKWGPLAIYKAGTSLRLCGIFNEPGGLGTSIALLLPLVHRKIKPWKEVVLILAGILAFSKAFYILFVIEVMGWVILRYEQEIRENWWKGLVLFLLCIMFVLIFPHIDFHNERINAFTNRMDLTQFHKIDNRTSADFDEFYEEFVHSNNRYWGLGFESEPVSSFGGLCSYKVNVVYFGFIGYGILVGLWFFCAMKECGRNKRGWLFVLIFFVSLYQRPGGLGSAHGYLTILAGIPWMREKWEKGIF